MPGDAINLYADEPVEMRLAGILGRIIKAGWLEYPRPGAAPELSRSGLRRQQRHSACGQALVRERGRYLRRTERRNLRWLRRG
jgi:hypothetical protein